MGGWIINKSLYAVLRVWFEQTEPNEKTVHKSRWGLVALIFHRNFFLFLCHDWNREFLFSFFATFSWWYCTLAETLTVAFIDHASPRSRECSANGNDWGDCSDRHYWVKDVGMVNCCGQLRNGLSTGWFISILCVYWEINKQLQMFAHGTVVYGLFVLLFSDFSF